MKSPTLNLGAALLAGFACAALPGLALAEPDAATKEALAKAVQNPVADLVSLPLQDNINFGVGPHDDKQTVVNIQPVVPFHLTPNWNLVTRTIQPLIFQPNLATGTGTINGVGDLQFSTFLSPAHSGPWVWGVGSILQAPTASNEVLGQGKWGIGPTAVVLHLERGSPWVYGALVNNVSSFAGGDSHKSVNQFLMQPFINYNIHSRPGMAISFSPIVTANWEATGSNVWTVPLGLGISQVAFIGNQAVSLQLAAYSNVVRPEYAGAWTARIQLAFLFPKSK